MVVGRVAGFPNENGGGGQEHRVNTNKEDKPTRALILVGCTFVELEEHRCTKCKCKKSTSNEIGGNLFGLRTPDEFSRRRIRFR